MTYRLKALLLTFSFFCFGTFAKAQISASFTATQTNICEGIAVGFIPTINSTNPVTSVFWDYGDGVFINDPVPYGSGYVYNTAGIYTVRLVVNDNIGNTDTTTVVNMVTVNPNPDINFTVNPNSGCQPLDVLLSASTTNSSTTGWTWTWIFSSDSICFAGDQQDTIIRTNPNPFSNTFTEDGIYDVKLVVENQLNCQSDTTIFNVFTVEPKPVASFSYQIQADCDTTTDVIFTSTSSLPCTPAPMYNWNFGDGNGSVTTTVPTYTYEYQTSGTFTVQLIVTDGLPNGCSDTTSQTIVINANPTVSIQAPLSACATESVQFNGTSSGVVINWAWDFGDGNTSNLQNPMHTYANPGCFTPSLTVTIDTCSFTTTFDTCIIVNAKPSAVFSSLNDFETCTRPYTMNFTSTVIGTLFPTYAWDFGDGTTSSLQNPTKTWNYAGSYPIVLTVSTPQGCTSPVLRDTVIIDSVNVDFGSNIVGGCEPLVVQFMDNSTSFTAATGWLWRFGDGNTSTQQNPTHTYISSGSYDVTLVVTTTQGCSDSLTISNYINVGTPPTLNFTVSDNAPCINENISFINNSDPSGTNWLWFNGLDTVSGFNIPDTFYANSGSYDIWLSGENNGCVDTLFSNNLINITDLEVDFNTDGDCNVNPTGINFTDNTTGTIVQWHYDFGVDGITDDTSNLQNPSYTYPSVGQYVALLTVTDASGCTLTDSVNIDLDPPVANFGWETDSVECVSINFPIVIVDSSQSHGGRCRWTMPDEAIFLFGSSDSICEPVISFDTAGIYNLTLVVRSDQGCLDTITKQICVTDVTAVANLDSTSGSGGLIESPVTYIQNGNSIVGGAGGCIIQLDSLTGDTTYITAIGTNPINCNNPNLSLYTGCAPLTVAFSDSSFSFPDSIVSYVWDFGDGNFSNAQNPTHIYDVSSGEYAYMVTLTVTNQYGVINTDTVSSFIRPTQPTSNFSISRDTACTNLAVTAADSSSGFDLTYYWTFGDGDTSVASNPSFSYTSEGTYQVCLTVTDINGCDSTVCDSIVILNPVANFSADTTYSECENLTVTFTDSSTNVVSWLWLFGNDSTSTVQNPSVVYSGTGAYDLTLIAEGAGSCQDTLTVNSFVQIDGPALSSMSVSPTDSCENHLVSFNVQGSNIGIVTIEYGDGNDTTLFTSTGVTIDLTIDYLYDTAGVYNPVLRIEDALNCERIFNFNTITTTDPFASFTVDTTLGCIPLAVSVDAAASLYANQYEWIAPGAFIAGQGSSAPSFIYQNEGYYNEITLVVTDVNNCTDTLSFTDTITAADAHAGFYPDNYTGCYPLTVQFTDTSYAFPDTIASWQWTFVNGGTSVLQNPSYTYNGAVNINQNARLDIVSSYGCTDNVQQNILPTFPTAAFVSDTLACTEQTVNFTNQSTGLNLTYSWDFGDDSTSTEINPTHFYAYEDTFQIILTVTDVNGCIDIDTLERVIVANPIANFTSDKVFIACAPDSVQFTDLSQNAIAWDWTIEGASPSNYNTKNPAVAYILPGVYDVELIITSPSGCQDTMQVDSMITVDGPYGTIDFAPTQGCVDLTVDFVVPLTNTANLIFDNGESVEVFVNPGDTLFYSYTYTQRGTYTPTVFIQDALGCQRTLTNDDIIVTDPEAIFTVTPDTACIPLTMTTTNSSLDVDDFEWIAPTLTIDNPNNFTPTFTTNNAGFHDISLVITDIYGCTDTTTQTILASTIQASASSNITAGCLPLTVQFTDLSTDFPVGSINSWLWTFGDGSGVSTDQNPTYVYTTIGNYTPVLTVTNAHGCTETFTLPSINVSFPNASYVPSLTFACTGQDILFDNQSSGQNVTYLWDFDNGQTSTQEDPTYAFPAEGIYNVCVTTTDDNGCDSTYCQTITIANPVANFTVDNQYLPCPPATFNFTDASANAVSWSWTFGDGNTSTNQNPSHTYTETGLYDVQLIVTSASGCMDTLFQPTFIEVGGPVGNFTFTPKQGCADVTATFTGNVTANTIDLYIWNYGDGSSTTSVTNANTSTVIHTYTTTGTFFPTLTLQDNTGCQFIATLDSIEVDTLQFDFFANDTLLCETGDFTFTPYIASSSPIDSVVWNFGGADITTSNMMSPTIPYSTVGDFDVTLTVYSRHCTKTITKTQYVKIAPIPVTNFTTVPTAGCNPTAVNFTDATSIFSGSVASWAWDFGNATVDSTQNASTTYITVGQYDVQLITISNHGCADTLLLVDTVTISPIPNPTFGLDTFACTGQDVFFTNTSTGNGLTYSWDFGDGNTSTLFEPVHQYANEGTFTVCLTVMSSDGCDSTLCKTLVIANPVAAFTSNTQYLPCVGDSIMYIDQSSNAIAWNWSFGDGDTSVVQNPTHTYTTTGFYDVQLIVQGASGCFDTLFQTNYIEVGGPISNFTFTPNQGCADVTATFTGNVTANTVDLYIWNYGDGNIDTTFSNALTDVVNHTYTMTGTFFPTLTTEDNTGCQFMSTLDSIEVDTLQFDFTVDTTLACENGTFTFTPTIASSSPIDSVVWNFVGADITTSNAMMPTVTYSNVGDFDVELTVYSRHCTKVITKPQLIKIAPDPVTNFTVSPAVGCNPTTVLFTDATSIFSGNVVSWAWDFGEGSLDSSQNTANSYDTVGVFDVQLITVSDFGCTNTLLLTDTITINPIPHPIFDLDTFACTGQDVFFTNTSTGNGLTYNWDFGDGNSSTAFEPVHQYMTEDTFTVCLTVTDVNGCDSTLCKTVIIANPVAAFTSNTQYLACPNDSILLTDQSINAIAWNWTFGDGDTSILQNPTHTYTATGFYDIQLIVQGASGCFDTLFQTAYIEVGGPVGNFTFTPKQGCADVTTTFVGTLTGNSIANYHWNFGNGDSITHATNMPIDSFDYIYTTSGTFFPTLTLEDSTGCSFDITLDSIEVDTLQFDFFASDTVFCETDNITFTPYIASSSPIDSVLWTFNGTSVTTSTMMMPTIPYDTIGDFDVTLTVFSNHCSKTITKTQYIKAAPIPTSYFTTATNPFCSEQTISFLDATSIFSGNVVSWNWNFGDLSGSNAQNPMHTYADSGFYNINLFVTSEYGCTDDTTITVYINKTPEPMMTTAPTLCIGEVTTLTASGGDTYEWYEGVNLICDTCTSIDVAPIVTTNYTLVAISAAGCRKSITQTVNVLQFAIPPLVVSNDTTICKGDVIQLFASGGYDVTQYDWDVSVPGLSCYNGCSNPFASPETTTTFYVTLTWDGGCSKTDSITVTVIDDVQPILGLDRTICQGESVQLGISTGGNATWFPGDGLTCVFCDNPVASPDITTTYSVEVVTVNGCTIRDTMTINVQTQNMIDAGIDATICDGNTIQLNGSAVGNVTWTPAATLTDSSIVNPIASPIVTTDYILTVQNDLCVQFDTVTITVADKVDIDVEDIEICEDEVAVIDIIGYAETFTFLPDTGILNIAPTLIQPTETTTYTVIGDIPLCESDTATFTITVNPIPDIGLLPQMTVFKNTVTPLPIDYPNSQYMHTWTPSTLLSCPDCFDPFFVADSTFNEMTVYVDLLTNEGCSFTDSIVVTLGENCGNDLVKLPTAFTPNDDGNNDVFRVRGVGIADIEIFRVYNRWGEQLFETSQLNEGWDGTHKGEKVEQGVYMYYVQAICPLTGEVLTFKGDVFLHF